MKLTKGIDIIIDNGTTLYCPNCAEESIITAFYNKKVKCPKCDTVHDILSTFPEKLKEYRELRGLSQRTLAEKMKIPRDCIKGYESGRTKPLPERMMKFNKLFDKAGIE